MHGVSGGGCVFAHFLPEFFQPKSVGSWGGAQASMRRLQRSPIPPGRAGRGTLLYDLPDPRTQAAALYISPSYATEYLRLTLTLTDSVHFYRHAYRGRFTIVSFHCKEGVKISTSEILNSVTCSRYLYTSGDVLTLKLLVQYMH